MILTIVPQRQSKSDITTFLARLTTATGKIIYEALTDGIILDGVSLFWNFEFLVTRVKYVEVTEMTAEEYIKSYPEEIRRNFEHLTLKRKLKVLKIWTW